MTKKNISNKISLIVGLGNPGEEYANTKHNAGFWFIEELAKCHNVSLSFDKKFEANIAKIKIQDNIIWLATPLTFMNLSGKTTSLLTSYYKIQPENTLVIHDELDLPPGIIKLKFDGGEGGHNGLKDISQKFGTKKYYRLRIGIGHPRNYHKNAIDASVTNYVLSKPNNLDYNKILDTINFGVNNIDLLAEGEIAKATTIFNSFRT